MADIGYAQAVCAEVVRRLREVREGRGMSKYALAQASGVSESMVGLVERGRRNPTLETVIKLARGLDVDLADVVRRASRSVSER